GPASLLCRIGVCSHACHSGAGSIPSARLPARGWGWPTSNEYSGSASQAESERTMHLSLLRLAVSGVCLTLLTLFGGLFLGGGGGTLVFAPLAGQYRGPRRMALAASAAVVGMAAGREHGAPHAARWTATDGLGGHSGVRADHAGAGLRVATDRADRSGTPGHADSPAPAVHAAVRPDSLSHRWHRRPGAGGRTTKPPPGQAPLCHGHFAAVFNHSATPSADGMTAYLAYWDAGAILLDMSVPSDLQMIGRTVYPVGSEGDTHSAVPNTASSLLVTTDEDFSPSERKAAGESKIVGDTWGFARIWGLTDPTHPAHLSDFATPHALTNKTDAFYSAHNPEIRGTTLYLSW